MTELEIKLCKALGDIIDCMYCAEDMYYHTGIQIERCQEILDLYYTTQRGLPR